MGASLQTSGNYATEDDAAAAFDAMAQTPYFRVYDEVPGQIMQPRIGCLNTNVRIDRILVPAPDAIAAGWNAGCIGIEMKRSGKKAGPIVAQCLDYMRAAFTLPTGNVCLLGTCFIWPLEQPKNDIASIMAQHRIGSVEPCSSGSLAFYLSAYRVLSLSANHVGCPHPKHLKNVGRKSGTR